METGTCGETHTKESRVTIEEMEDFVSLLSDYLFLSENHIFYLRMIGSLSDGQRRLSSKHSLNLGTTKTGSIFAFNPCRPNVFSELLAPQREGSHPQAHDSGIGAGDRGRTEEERVTPSPVRFPRFPPYLILCPPSYPRKHSLVCV